MPTTSWRRDTDEEREQLVAEVDRLLRCLARATGAVPPALSAVEQRLTMGQYRLLMILARAAGPMTIGALREHLGVGGPSVSRMVERLVREEMVDRRDDPADRRRALVELSPTARALLADAQRDRDAHHVQLHQRIARLDGAALRRFEAALRAVAEVAEQAE